MYSGLTSGLIVVYILIYVLFGPVLGAGVGSAKGRAGFGFLLGLFLGVIGVVIVALLPPTDAKQAERDQAQARAIRNELVPAGAIATSATAGTTPPVAPPSRQTLLAEAIRRDPTLEDAGDPATLKRLAATVAELEEEFQLRAELQQMQRQKAAAAADAGIVEWRGTEIATPLRPVHPAAWEPILEGDQAGDRWAKLELAPNGGGQLQLTATVWGQPVAELGVAELTEHPALIEAVGQGVNVGVLRLDRAASEPTVTLHLGRSYTGRPKAPWE